jgi:hypothetical protein
MADFRAWSASAYLRHYYACVEDDEAATLAFLVDALRSEPPAAETLEFGAGPTLHHLLPLAPRAAAIDVADLLDDNLGALRAWIGRRPGAHDWRPFTRHVLACEGRTATATQVAAREALLRHRVRRLVRADAAHPDPLGAAGRARYGIVLSCFCADSATDDKATWARYMRHIGSLVAPGGLLLLAALRRCRAYGVGERRFPSADVDECDIAAQLHAGGFAPAGTRIEVVAVPRQRPLGYDGIVLAAARREPAQAHCGATPGPGTGRAGARRPPPHPRAWADRLPAPDPLRSGAARSGFEQRVAPAPAGLGR